MNELLKVLAGLIKLVVPKGLKKGKPYEPIVVPAKKK